MLDLISLLVVFTCTGLSVDLVGVEENVGFDVAVLARVIESVGLAEAVTLFIVCSSLISSLAMVS